MLELDKQYPQYQLARHKGYPTKLHYELIAQYGIQPFYRRSFLKKQATGMTDVGHTGEAVAAKYYQQRGWLLLNHNYRTRLGELDLILYKGNTLVFAEVKTRTARCWTAPPPRWTPGSRTA